MFPHLYRTYINARGEGNLLELIIDLGFHVLIKRVITTEEPIDYRVSPGSCRRARGRRSSGATPSGPSEQ